MASAAMNASATMRSTSSHTPTRMAPAESRAGRFSKPPSKSAEGSTKSSLRLRRFKGRQRQIEAFLSTELGEVHRCLEANRRALDVGDDPPAPAVVLDLLP